MRFHRIEVQNYMRIQSAAVDPITNVVTFTGPNEAGKSSWLDAIWVLLTGGTNIKDVPVHRGAEEAVIKGWLGDDTVELIATRVIKPDRSTRLTLHRADGRKIAGAPQEIVNELLGGKKAAALAFDPLEFERMKPADRRAALARILNIDVPLAEIARRRGDAFDARTVVNRLIKEMTARIDALPVGDVPLARIDVAALLDELKRRDEANRTNTVTVTRLAELRNEVTTLDSMIQEARAKMDRWMLAGTAKLAEIATLETLQLVQDNTEPLRDEIRTAQTVNKECDRRDERVALETKRAEWNAQVTALEAELAAVDAAQLALMRATKMPVDGLGLGDDDVTYHDLPFDSASDAMRWIVSARIAMSQHPKLRVMRVRNAGMLDRKRKALLQDMATGLGLDDDWQIFAEEVDESGTVGIFMEDGAVKADNYHTPPAGARPTPPAASPEKLPWE